MTELLPCPFCGGEATVERIGKSGYFYVACNTAYCCDFGKYNTEAEAIAAWNTRYHSAFEETVIKAWQEIKEYQEPTCRIEERHGDWYCTRCDEMVGTCDPASELCVSGNMIELWNYCPFCGSKVVGE